jgi:hypothetical protein
MRRKNGENKEEWPTEGAMLGQSTEWTMLQLNTNGVTVTVTVTPLEPAAAAAPSRRGNGPVVLVTDFQCIAQSACPGQGMTLPSQSASDAE